MAQYGLDTEIQFLPGVGPKRAALFSKELGITTVGDMIRTYPFRYIDRSTFVRIADARPDMAYVQVRAKVLKKAFREADERLDWRRVRRDGTCILQGNKMAE